MLPAMKPKTLRLAKLGAFIAGGGLVMLVALSRPSQADESGSTQASPLEKLFAVCKASGGSMKFESAQSCAASNCHGGSDSPITFASANTIYSDKDRHKDSYDTLTKNPKSATIAAALKIDKPEASDRCLSCHAIDAPASMIADAPNGYQVSEGVSCNACHGPSSKWHDPHKEEDWTNNQRKAAGYQLVSLPPGPKTFDTTDHEFTGGAQDKILQQWGLYDTKPVLARAETCTKCHLSIDASMVDAGHPQPVFELVYYQVKEHKHWVDPGGYFTTKLWAAGQITCLREAMKQLAQRAADANTSPDRLKEAYEIAMSHLTMVDALATSNAIKVSAGDLEKSGQAIKDAWAAKDTAKLSAAAANAGKMYDDLAKASEDFAPDKAATVSLIAAIAANGDASKDFGRCMAQQQTYSVAYLYSAYASVEKPDTKPDFKPLLALAINKNKEAKSIDEDFDAAGFSKAMSDVAGQLPEP
jgi:hypothetical protein